MTPPEHRFKEGDRVQLIRTFAGVPIGTYGTILMQFASQSLYDACFVVSIEARIVQDSYLAPAPPES